MKEVKYKVEISEFEQSVLINGMNEFRSMLLKTDVPTEDVDNLILKLIDLKPIKAKRLGYEAR